MKKTLGIIGARGHTGAELIRLVAAHPQLELAFVSSRELAGQPLAAHNPAYQGALCYENLDAAVLVKRRADAIVLALPNGKSADYVAAIEAHHPDTVIVDLSADYRFDKAWYYGLPELTRQHYRGQRRISNPGCYATAMQLAIAPFKADLAAPVQCFGVSGYSGAGTTPSDKNNVELLRDNLMPYALTGHLHEREVTRHTASVEFMPHVAPHFRGLSITANLHLKRSISAAQALQQLREFYAGEPLVAVSQDAAWVSRVAGRHHAMLGGFTVDEGGRRLVLVSVLDNLLKGAATQAMQNLNLAFGFDELAGIFPSNSSESCR
ncbi:N-acetyl-gamma-glutamyl-phosphate reductase [Lysobacteraceae bacterium NML75-0749]|nr:N-acetyl-gamma-glutamyl-phosphate reductase [Xanthomonadaceae bacterium NML75-0749]PJK05812.1 N-acetyl-gamma-glutamyl-phosphate reductase [Xanthomonadaceae bacterium NML91-0268]